MASQKKFLFKSCYFVLSDNVPHRDQLLWDRVKSLGFRINYIEPHVVIKKSSSTASDIEKLVRVVDEACDFDFVNDFPNVEQVINDKNEDGLDLDNSPNTNVKFSSDHVSTQYPEKQRLYQFEINEISSNSTDTNFSTNASTQTNQETRPTLESAISNSPKSIAISGKPQAMVERNQSMTSRSKSCKERGQSQREDSPVLRCRQPQVEEPLITKECRARARSADWKMSKLEEKNRELNKASKEVRNSPQQTLSTQYEEENETGVVDPPLININSGDPRHIEREKPSYKLQIEGPMVIKERRIRNADWIMANLEEKNDLYGELNGASKEVVRNNSQQTQSTQYEEENENGVVDSSLKQINSEDSSHVDREKPSAYTRNERTEKTSGYSINAETEKASGNINNAETEKASGYSNHKDTEKASGYSNHAETEKASGYSNHVETEKTSGYSNHAETEKTSGYSIDAETEKAKTEKASGYSNHAETEKASGYSNHAKTEKTSGYSINAETEKASGNMNNAETEKASQYSNHAETEKASGYSIDAQPEKASGNINNAETEKASGNINDAETEKASGYSNHAEIEKTSGYSIDAQPEKASGYSINAETEKASGYSINAETEKTSGYSINAETEKTTGYSINAETEKASGCSINAETEKASGNINYAETEDWKMDQIDEKDDCYEELRWAQKKVRNSPQLSQSTQCKEKFGTAVIDHPQTEIASGCSRNEETEKTKGYTSNEGTEMANGCTLNVEKEISSACLKKLEREVARDVDKGKHDIGRENKHCPELETRKISDEHFKAMPKDSTHVRTEAQPKKSDEREISLREQLLNFEEYFRAQMKTRRHSQAEGSQEFGKEAYTNIATNDQFLREFISKNVEEFFRFQMNARQTLQSEDPENFFESHKAHDFDDEENLNPVKVAPPLMKPSDEGERPYEKHLNANLCARNEARNSKQQPPPESDIKVLEYKQTEKECGYTETVETERPRKFKGEDVITTCKKWQCQEIEKTNKAGKSFHKIENQMASQRTQEDQVIKLNETEIPSIEAKVSSGTTDEYFRTQSDTRHDLQAEETEVLKEENIRSSAETNKPKQQLQAKNITSPRSLSVNRGASEIDPLETRKISDKDFQAMQRDSTHVRSVEKPKESDEREISGSEKVLNVEEYFGAQMKARHHSQAEGSQEFGKEAYTNIATNVQFLRERISKNVEEFFRFQMNARQTLQSEDPENFFESHKAHDFDDEENLNPVKVARPLMKPSDETAEERNSCGYCPDVNKENSDDEGEYNESSRRSPIPSLENRRKLEIEDLITARYVSPEVQERKSLSSNDRETVSHFEEERPYEKNLNINLCARNESDGKIMDYKQPEKECGYTRNIEKERARKYKEEENQNALQPTQEDQVTKLNETEITSITKKESSCTTDEYCKSQLNTRHDRQAEETEASDLDKHLNILTEYPSLREYLHRCAEKFKDTHSVEAWKYGQKRREGNFAEGHATGEFDEKHSQNTKDFVLGQQCTRREGQYNGNNRRRPVAVLENRGKLESEHLSPARNVSPDTEETKYLNSNDREKVSHIEGERPYEKHLNTNLCGRNEARNSKQQLPQESDIKVMNYKHTEKDRGYTKNIDTERARKFKEEENQMASRQTQEDQVTELNETEITGIAAKVRSDTTDEYFGTEMDRGHYLHSEETEKCDLDKHLNILTEDRLLREYLYRCAEKFRDTHSVEAWKYKQKEHENNFAEGHGAGEFDENHSQKAKYSVSRQHFTSREGQYNGSNGRRPVAVLENRGNLESEHLSPVRNVSPDTQEKKYLSSNDRENLSEIEGERPDEKHLNTNFCDRNKARNSKQQLSQESHTKAMNYKHTEKERGYTKNIETERVRKFEGEENQMASQQTQEKQATELKETEITGIAAQVRLDTTDEYLRTQRDTRHDLQAEETEESDLEKHLNILTEDPSLREYLYKCAEKFKETHSVEAWKYKQKRHENNFAEEHGAGEFDENQSQNAKDSVSRQQCTSREGKTSLQTQGGRQYEEHIVSSSGTSYGDEEQDNISEDRPNYTYNKDIWGAETEIDDDSVDLKYSKRNSRAGKFEDFDKRQEQGVNIRNKWGAQRVRDNEDGEPQYGKHHSRAGQFEDYNGRQEQNMNKRNKWGSQRERDNEDGEPQYGKHFSRAGQFEDYNGRQEQGMNKRDKWDAQRDRDNEDGEPQDGKHFSRAGQFENTDIMQEKGLHCRHKWGAQARRDNEDGELQCGTYRSRTGQFGGNDERQQAGVSSWDKWDAQAEKERGADQRQYSINLEEKKHLYERDSKTNERKIRVQRELEEEQKKPLGAEGSTYDEDLRVLVESHKGQLVTEKNFQTERQLNEMEISKHTKILKLEIKLDRNRKQCLPLVSYFALLPKKQNCSTVNVSWDELDDSVIRLNGEKEEVKLIACDILEALKQENIRYFVEKKKSKQQPQAIKLASPRSPSLNRKAPEIDSMQDAQNSYHESERRVKVESSVDPPLGSLSGVLITEESGIKVQVLKADITAQRVDAIVNAANSSLKFTSGVSKVIADNAGPELVWECQNFVEGGKNLSATEIFVSDGGKLPARYIIHAVGPNWRAYREDKKEDCARDLRLTVLHCLLEAAALGCRSIAIPSISAAIFRVPLPICVKAYLEAVQVFDIHNDKYLKSSLKEILFVDIADKMIEVIQHHFTSEWENKPPPKQLTADFQYARTLYQQRGFRKSLPDERGDQYEQTSPVTQSGSDTQRRYSSPKSVTQSDSDTQRRYSSPKSVTQSDSDTQRRYSSPKPVQPSSEASYQKLPGYFYFVGECSLRASTEPALRQRPDFIVLLGESFKNLHWRTDVDVKRSIKMNTKFPSRKSIFRVLGGQNNTPLIFQFLLERYDRESVDKAFMNIREQASMIGAFAPPAPSVVFTCVALYGGRQAGRSPHEVDGELVIAFTRNVCECLREPALRLHNGLVTIAAGYEAMVKVHKFLQSSVGNQETKAIRMF
ncbi:macro domain-containing protein sco6450 [Plakobranchus ocellatus]|uniref:Macro domain-containing protein sco6450 n=1 Tax=Plakobranchus ocellatus TaxID=259542 RepID=A0AAV4A6U3_9GAST|nr:macro domain-containing protein sco6450 [Plakobranchus ocellatus]